MMLARSISPRPWKAIAGLMAVIAGGAGCGGGTPTTLLLSLLNGEGSPEPDVVQVRVFDVNGLSYSPSLFAVPDGADRELGTVVIYPKGSLSLRVEAIGAKKNMAVSQGAFSVDLVPGRQNGAEIVLRPGPLPDGDQDGVPDEIDNCVAVSNSGQEDSDGNRIGNACPSGGGARSLGVACGSPGECASGFCVDGVCCDSKCDQMCQACQVTGSRGTCRPVPAGEDPRGVCATSPPESCGLDGACDGSGACRRHKDGTVCTAAGCSSAVDRTLPRTCDGAGTCRMAESRTCAPYACEAGDCRTSCRGDADCSPGRACVDRTCGLKSLGSACAAGPECDSGQCIDGVCCDVADCTGPCRACNVAGAEGSCRPIRAGEEPRAPGCMADAPTSCGQTGKCDGAGACQKHPAGTACGASQCMGASVTKPACDGAGVCGSASTTSCAPYTCANGACLTSCGSAAQCVTGASCQGGVCRAKTANGGACGGATECASGNCVEGLCCATACGAGFSCPGGQQCVAKKALGAGCNAASECGSGFCVDSRCCDTACTETCKRCHDPNALGTCVFVANGAIDQNAPVPCRRPMTCDGAGMCR